MMIDIWWFFVIPLIFGLGWFAARIEQKEKSLPNTQASHSYVKGLNHLLSENHDAAIDAFVEAAALDPETTDLHFALGNLFRRRGETYRAIRVHQNLAQRPDVKTSIQAQAQFELGLDFLKAGMFDGAEKAFLSLENNPEYQRTVQDYLIDLYELQKDWPKAIAVAKAPNLSHDAAIQNRLAHFYCELAQGALQQQQIDQAMQWVNCARAILPDHPRSHLLLAQCLIAQEAYDKALDELRAMQKLTQGKAWLAVSTPLMLTCAQHLGQETNVLQEIHQTLLANPNPEVAEILYSQAQKILPTQTYLDTLTRAQEQYPDLINSRYLLQAYHHHDKNLSPHTQGVIAKTIAQTIASQPRYTCQNCGFRVRHFYWQCPGCNHWDTYQP